MSDGRLRETMKAPVSAGHEEANERGRQLLKKPREEPKPAKAAKSPPTATKEG